MKSISVLLGVASIAALFAAGAEAGTLWIGNMTGAQENPPNGLPFTGTGVLILNDTENSAAVSATHNVPNNTVVDGHIHRAPRGVNGPVIFPFPRGPGNAPAGQSPVGPLTWAIPSAEVANLKAGNLYFNIHTQQFPAGAIRGQIERFSFAPAAGNATQAAMAAALDASFAFSPDLDQALVGLAIGPTADRTAALDQLSGHTVYAQGRQAVETMADFEETIFGHAEALAATPDGGTGGFITAGTVFGSRDTREGQAGAKISRPFVLGGVDMALSNWRAGAAVGFASGKDKFRNGVGRTEADTTSVQAWLSTGGAGGVVFTAVAGYGWTEFETTRSLAALSRTATSSHDGRVWSLGAKISAPMSFGGFDLSPYALADYQRAKIDAYTESGAGAVGLVVPGRKETSAAVEAGAAAAVPVSSGDAPVTARFRLGGRYLLDDSEDDFATSLVGSPVAFQTDIHSPGRAALRAEASLTGAVGGGLNWSASYRGLISKRTDIHTLELRLSLRM